MQRIVIQREKRSLDGKQEVAHYRSTPDGWEVDTTALDGQSWRTFSTEDAGAVDVRQLLRKEYDVRY